MDRYSVVTTSATKDTVERYLYEHTTIVEEGNARRSNGGKVSFFVLKTTVEGDDPNVEHRAAYLQQYQLDRLASGLHFGKPVESLDAARAVVADALTKEYY